MNGVCERARLFGRTTKPDWSWDGKQECESLKRALPAGRARRVSRPDGKWVRHYSQRDTTPSFYERNNPAKESVRIEKRVTACELNRSGTWTVETKRLPVEKIDENGNKVTIWVRLSMLTIALTVGKTTFTFRGKQGASSMLDSRDGKRKSQAFVKSEIARLGIKVVRG